jgi:hypothetical protein
MEAGVDDKRSKAELLEEIQMEWELLEALLMELDEEQMLDTRAQDGWSVKDILAHITFWERLALDRMYAARDGKPIQIELVGSWDVDGLNTQTYNENKERPLDEVLADTQNIHSELMNVLEGSEAAFIEGPLPFDWAEGTPVWRFVGENTSWHYKEHRQALEAWIEAQ